MERGCGEREENGLYVCTTTSPFGMPLEHFLVDPVRNWEGGQLRAPMLIQDRSGTSHILLGIGEKYYPTVPSFVEEAKVLGVSKRVPNDFDLSPLTPGKSKLLLTHPRAIPKFPYVIMDVKCPRSVCDCKWHCRPVTESKHDCIGALWPLSALTSRKKVHEVKVRVGGATVTIGRDKTVLERIFENVNAVEITTPSVSYEVSLPDKPIPGNLKYAAGIIFSFPQIHFEYVSKSRKIPPEMRKKFEVAEWRLEVCPE